MAINKLEKQYHVHVYETGPDGKLSLLSLFDYLQDIASDHAVKLGYGRDDLMKANRLWVLSRMYAVITTFPGWGETVTVVTWPKGTEKLFALRDYEMRSPEGEIMAAASSSWLIIDQRTKRICRPDHTLYEYNSALYKRDSLQRNAAKLEPGRDEMKVLLQFRVRINDLDVNLHSNNVKYLKWVTDTYDLDFVMNNIPYSVEINYLAESRFNDEIIILGTEAGESEKFFDYNILRPDDNTCLCRIRIGWIKKNIS